MVQSFTPLVVLWQSCGGNLPNIGQIFRHTPHQALRSGYSWGIGPRRILLTLLAILTCIHPLGSFATV